MDFMDSPALHEPDAEHAIFEATPAIPRPGIGWYTTSLDARPDTDRDRPRTTTTPLTAWEERILFRRYNYARFRVASLQDEIGPGGPTDEQARALLRWSRTAWAWREQLAEMNLGLVLAMTRRMRMKDVDHGELVSEGNMALLRSIDKFDCERGFKFSTYACRAILKSFSRLGMKNTRYRERFPTQFDPALERSNHLEEVRRQRELEDAREVRHIVARNKAHLEAIELTVLRHRFALEDRAARPMTLKEVGVVIGVSKERVRQIQNRALSKIRAAFEEDARPWSSRRPCTWAN